ncbi:transmembrane amino acid transporter family protein [Pelomyxa schiedti]|nr:transmembrane amino acid transporter family protein [Pelomyxa schiedti]
MSATASHNALSPPLPHPPASPPIGRHHDQPQAQHPGGGPAAHHPIIAASFPVVLPAPPQAHAHHGAVVRGSTPASMSMSMSSTSIPSVDLGFDSEAERPHFGVVDTTGTGTTHQAPVSVPHWDPAEEGTIGIHEDLHESAHSFSFAASASTTALGYGRVVGRNDRFGVSTESFPSLIPSPVPSPIIGNLSRSSSAFSVRSDTPPVGVPHVLTLDDGEQVMVNLPPPPHTPLNRSTASLPMVMHEDHATEITAAIPIHDEVRAAIEQGLADEGELAREVSAHNLAIFSAPVDIEPISTTTEVVMELAGNSQEGTKLESVEMSEFPMRPSMEGQRQSLDSARPSLDLLPPETIPTTPPKSFREFVTENVPGKGTVLEAIANVTNSVMALGIVGTPCALADMGLPFGIMTFIGVAIIIDLSLLLLIYMAEKSSIFDYQGLCYKAYGKFGYYAISIICYAQAFGSMVTYLVIIGDSFTVIIEKYASDIPVISDRRFIITVLVLLIVFPLTLLKSVHKLAYSSYLSLFSVVFVTVSVAIQSQLQGAPSVEKDFKFAHKQFPLGIGIIAFAFVCHHITFEIYTSLRAASLWRWGVITHISLGVAFTLAMTISLFGYLTFFNTTAGNILNNFSADSTLINIARVLYGVSSLLTYPIEQFVARSFLIKTFLYHPTHRALKFYIVTAAQVIVTLVIALVVTDVAVVLSLVGGVVTSNLGFVIPGFLALKLVQAKVLTPKKIFSIGMIVFGVFLMISSPTLIIKDIISPPTSPSSSSFSPQSDSNSVI